jgi:hypothetical protein
MGHNSRTPALISRKMVVMSTVLVVAAGVWLMAIAPSASNGASGSTRQTVYVDSYGVTGTPPVVTTTAALTLGTQYTMTVRGSYSAWFEWPRNYVCGTPRLFPAYPTPGRPLSKTGFDAQFKFAVPAPDAKTCASIKLPAAAVLFQINAGDKWVHPTIKGAVPTVPNRNHSYTYDVVGQGKPLSLRIVDFHATDNDGRFRVTIAPS